MMQSNTESALFLIHSLTPASSQSQKAWQGGSFLASSRIQLEPARRATEQLGITPVIRNIRSEKPDFLTSIGTAKFCIIGKLSHPDKDFASRIAIANLAAIPILKRKKIPIITTYSDNLASLGEGPISELYRSLLWNSDVVVYPCRAMNKLGEKWYDPRIKPTEWIIEDPWQVKEKPFKVLKHQEACRIIWFGHSSNAIYLINELNNILGRCDSWNEYELTVLTDEETGKLIHSKFHQIPARRPWKLRLSKWEANSQPTQLNEELNRAHIALLPSDPSNTRKSAASHNRAVDSIQGGCMTISSPLDSYMELKKLLLTTNDFAEMLNAGIKDHNRLTKKWGQTRRDMLKQFSPEENLQCWKRLILSLSKQT